MRSYPETYNPQDGFRDKITLKLKRVLVLIEANRKNWLPDKTADISRCYHWFPREMKSEKAAPKFHTDDVSLSRSYSDTSLVWKFCSQSFDVILREISCSVGKYQLFSHSPKLGGWGGGERKTTFSHKN